MTLHLNETTAVVSRVLDVADGVRSIELVSIDGSELPEWSPGAHLDVVVADGIERQYSLCGDPADRGSWRIAVLREDGGRGASVLLHSDELLGTTMRLRGPLNHFGFEPAASYLFIAGGIGITPLIAMIRTADAAGADWTLAYAGRSRRTMAFLDELEAAYGERILVFAGDEGQRLNVAALTAAMPAGSLVYCCGPTALLADAEAAAVDLPHGSLHLERFEAKETGAPVLDDSFEVELSLTGVTVTVPPDRSILDVVEDAGVLVLSSCREGTCGTCETPVVSGEVDHRDSVLTPDEQADNEVMMICVSRAACPRLVLEL
ncbi:PDR/VanB family oxidoreductase [Agreia sp. COWG]|uniref:PDR/VanB family oxidoreductase n=1 Tax=Agreia sp. COWG TaxID=2773266 RepID=UPI001925C89F|nr:PDR/VanB family oxidoreductase [Agreia sp. COWG]CAD5995093.1 Phenoxybenzoate dioxygenase subunit beta [Agreia sp. COWG]